MRVSEKKRQQILTAAEQMFKEYGYAGTSMDKVAEVAEVSKRTVYNHFPSKEELFNAIVLTHLRHLKQVDDQPFDASVAIDEQLKALAWHQIRTFTQPEFVDASRMFFIEMLRDAELAQQLMANAEGIEQGLTDWMQQANDAGMLTLSDSLFAARQFLYQIKSFAYYPMLYGNVTLSEQELCYIVDQTVAMFLSHYGRS